MSSAVPNHRPNGVDALVQPDGRSGTAGYLEVARLRGAGEAAASQAPRRAQFNFWTTILVRRRWCHVFQKSAWSEPPGSIAPIIMSDTRWHRATLQLEIPYRMFTLIAGSWTGWVFGQPVL